MKTLKELKVGDTARGGEALWRGSSQTPNYGHGADERGGCADSQGGSIRRSD